MSGEYNCFDGFFQDGVLMDGLKDAFGLLWREKQREEFKQQRVQAFEAKPRNTSIEQLVGLVDSECSIPEKVLILLEILETCIKNNKQIPLIASFNSDKECRRTRLVQQMEEIMDVYCIQTAVNPVDDAKFIKSLDSFVSH